MVYEMEKSGRKELGFILGVKKGERSRNETATETNALLSVLSVVGLCLKQGNGFG